MLIICNGYTVGCHSFSIWVDQISHGLSDVAFILFSNTKEYRSLAVWRMGVELFHNSMPLEVWETKEDKDLVQVLVPD